MSTTKSRRRRLLLLLGAFLLVAGGATATTLALRPHAHPVAAPRRETTTTTVRTVSYPAVALPEDVNDGIHPWVFETPPACSPGGGTCLVGEIQPRTGNTHLLMSVNGGRTWVPGSTPGLPVPPGSGRQWAPTVQAGCVSGKCFFFTTSSRSGIWTCRVVAGRVTCSLAPTPSLPVIHGLTCVSDQRCYVVGGATLGESELRVLDPTTGQVGAVAGLMASAPAPGCGARRARARTVCPHGVVGTTEGTVMSLHCSPTACAGAVGVTEIGWLDPSVTHPARPVVATVRDLALGGEAPPEPVTQTFSGKGTVEILPDSRASCFVTTWCVGSVAVAPHSVLAWQLVAAASNPQQQRFAAAWVVFAHGRWLLQAHRPAGGIIQTTGAVTGGHRWCGRSFCVRLTVSPDDALAVQRVPVRAAGTKDERAR